MPLWRTPTQRCTTPRDCCRCRRGRRGGGRDTAPQKRAPFKKKPLPGGAKGARRAWRGPRKLGGGWGEGEGAGGAGGRGRGTQHGRMDPLQAKPLSGGGQRARGVLDGARESAGDDRGRRWALGAPIQEHVRLGLLEASGVPALARDAGAWTAV